MHRIALILILALAGNALAGAEGPPLRTHYPLDRIAPGVYVVHGPRELPNADNQGFMNNPSFLVTEQGVVVVDPGGTLQAGRMLVGKIRATTDKPVVAVFNTHVHGDHWLGNQAIVEAWPQAVIYAHPKMIEEAKAGVAAEWVDLMLRLTEGASAGTEAVLPTRTVDEGDRITVGGLHFRILHEGPAHTDTDIVILVEEKGLVYLGDNAGNGRILRMQNGSFRGNVAALERALTLGATVFVPGHGPSGGAEVARGYRDFLKTLYETVQAGYEDGKADFEIRPELLPKLTAWQDWAGFEHELGGLLSAAYLEAEAADFE